MASITSWMRLEPRSRTAGMDTSLQARIYDPLWLLARQWQFGEFQGEDNGSPIMASWRAESARLARYHAGSIAPNARVDAPRYDGSRMPLEALVERETIRRADPRASPLDKIRLAVEAGQQFLRMLGAQPAAAPGRDYGAAFTREYGLLPPPELQRAALDRDTLGYVDLMAHRVPDGRRLYAAFGMDDVVLSPSLGIDSADLAEVEDTARRWRRWFETLHSEPEAAAPAWLPERMEYAFSVGTRLGDGEHVLTAHEYPGGHLDWYAFDWNPDVTLGGASDDVVTTVACMAIPAPVSFRGMPATRFWEFEDAQVDFGAVDAGPIDLARMLLVEFALSYGKDWFVLPVDLAVGAIYHTRSLVIADTFGVRTLIKPSSELGTPHSAWRMFEHAYTRSSGIIRPAANMFFLPPSLLRSIDGRPVEDVLFLRDEMANYVWGVERVIESPIERPLDCFNDVSRHQRAQPAPEDSSATGPLHYRLLHGAPANWIPFIPVRTPQGFRLRRGALLHTTSATDIGEARGRILSDSGRALELYEEEVPREGLQVTRRYQYTRWTDGSTHLWIGRHKRIGHGEGSSGLRFDVLERRTEGS